MPFLNPNYPDQSARFQKIAPRQLEREPLTLTAPIRAATIIPKKKKKNAEGVTVATPLGVRGVKARSAAGSSARTDGLLLGRRMCQVSGPFTTEVMSVLLQ